MPERGSIPLAALRSLVHRGRCEGRGRLDCFRAADPWPRRGPGRKTSLGEAVFRGRSGRADTSRPLGRGRRFTPHGLRHTFASIHLARGTNLKWIQAQGGWASAKVLLDCYGHYLRKETTGYADALSVGSKRLYPAPSSRRRAADRERLPSIRRGTRSCVAPRGGIEPPTRCLEDPLRTLMPTELTLSTRQEAA